MDKDIIVKVAEEYIKANVWKKDDLRPDAIRMFAVWLDKFINGEEDRES